MALEPTTVSAEEEGDDSELVDRRRRFWGSLILTLPAETGVDLTELLYEPPHELQITLLPAAPIPPIHRLANLP